MAEAGQGDKSGMTTGNSHSNSAHTLKLCLPHISLPPSHYPLSLLLTLPGWTMMKTEVGLEEEPSKPCTDKASLPWTLQIAPPTN